MSKKPPPRKPPPPTLGASWDMDGFLKHLNADDHLRLVLGAHLFMEAVLGELIRAVLPFPEDLKIQGRRFDERLNLAAALGLLHPTEVPAYRAINDLRNELAHGLADYITVEQSTRILRALGPYQRELVRHNVGDREPKPADLQVVLSTLFFQLKAHIDSLPEFAKLDPVNTWRARMTSTLRSGGPFKFHDESEPRHKHGGPKKKLLPDK